MQHICHNPVDRHCAAFRRQHFSQPAYLLTRAALAQTDGKRWRTCPAGAPPQPALPLVQPPAPRLSLGFQIPHDRFPPFARHADDFAIFTIDSIASADAHTSARSVVLLRPRRTGRGQVNFRLVREERRGGAPVAFFEDHMGCTGRRGPVLFRAVRRVGLLRCESHVLFCFPDTDF